MTNDTFPLTNDNPYDPHTGNWYWHDGYVAGQRHAADAAIKVCEEAANRCRLAGQHEIAAALLEAADDIRTLEEAALLANMK